MSYFDQIDREFMIQIKRFKVALMDFSAFRKLWARRMGETSSVRNKFQPEIDELEKEQTSAIVELLNIAENIRKHIGLKWVTVLSSNPEDTESQDGFYLIEKETNGETFMIVLESYDDGKVRGPNQDGIVVDQARGTIDELITSYVNDGFTIDGPIRCPRLR